MTAINQCYDAFVTNFVDNCPSLSRNSSTIQKICLIAVGVFLVCEFLFAGMMVASNPQVLCFSQWSASQICFFTTCLGMAGIMLISYLFFNSVNKKFLESQTTQI
jgi:hypothetical protein